MMVGRYEIEITNNRVTIFLEIKRNITNIQGDSATGKTTLIRMLSEYNRLGMSSGVTVKCQKECVALVDSDWKHFINNSRDRIIFLDENNQFIRTKEFAEAVSASDNYYVLIIRDSLPQLSYAIEEIYGMREIRDSQKYIKPKHVYNELYRLYNLCIAKES
jgi:ABC-type phosphate/phosphonate transport system ATPase subunit